jgi:Zn-dependent protease with chaperone function
MKDSLTVNPTDRVTVDFPSYVAMRMRGRAEHLVNGCPDYSFSLDNELRRRLNAMGTIRNVARFLVRTLEPLAQQRMVTHGIAVGPNQFPKIFEMGQHCARTLGIGTPRIFIESVDMMNAYTSASDDVAPSVVLTTRLTRSMKDDELLAIIGHECGHIHNLHVAYNTVVAELGRWGQRTALAGAILAGAPLLVLKGLMGALGAGMRLFLLRWSRCAEITSDRAAAICAGSASAAIRALVKLETMGELPLDSIDVDTYVRQLDAIKGSAFRLTELTATHPLMQKRVEALRLFHNSETFLSWRPDLRTDGPVRTHRQLETACEELVSVTGKKRSYTEGEISYELSS